MAAFRFSRSDESQVDPFNAGEPEMPGGEPDFLAEDDEPEVEYTAHGEPGGTPHKPEDNYQAPVARGHDYDAPSIDEPRRTARRRRGAPRRRADATGEVQQRTEKDRRLVTKVVIALVLIVSFGSSLVSCAASLVGGAVEGAGEAVESLGDVFFEDDGDDWASDDWEEYVPEQDADDEAAATALQARLDELLADPGSGRLHDTVTAYLDAKMLDIEGYSAAELGLDAGALATLLLENVDAKVSYAYAFSDGTASGYADVTSPGASELFWALDDAFGTYLIDNDLWGRGDGTPTDEHRAHVAAAAEDVLADLGEDAETYMYTFELDLVDDTWVVDEQDLFDTFEMALALY